MSPGHLRLADGRAGAHLALWPCRVSRRPTGPVVCGIPGEAREEGEFFPLGGSNAAGVTRLLASGL